MGREGKEQHEIGIYQISEDSSLHIRIQFPIPNLLISHRVVSLAATQVSSAAGETGARAAGVSAVSTTDSSCSCAGLAGSCRGAHRTEKVAQGHSLGARWLEPCLPSLCAIQF